MLDALGVASILRPFAWVDLGWVGSKIALKISSARVLPDKLPTLNIQAHIAIAVVALGYPHFASLVCVNPVLLMPLMDLGML